MKINEFFNSFLMIINQMSPYLLLGFLIAGVLHVFVPKKFYQKYLSSNNKFSVLWAALLGIPLPLCSCGVIPTAIGLKNEKASKGAVASFLIATPQTGIDSILATFSLMGLGFAIMRPVAALITGICGGILINRYLNKQTLHNEKVECVIDDNKIENTNILHKLYKILRYAYFDMIQDIGLRLSIGLLLAALINVAVPDEFFLKFSSNTLLQMIIILIIAIPMYVCSTGGIPIAASLMMKGLSPGVALVLLMAGPAVNLASILVVKKSMGIKFTTIYLSVIILGAVLFGFLANGLPSSFFNISSTQIHYSADVCCDTVASCCQADTTCCDTNHNSLAKFPIFNVICSILLVIFIINSLIMKFISRFKKISTEKNTVIYIVEEMHCNHCKKAVEESVMKVEGVQTAEANAGANTLIVTGNAKQEDIKQVVEKAGFVFKGVKQQGNDIK